MGGTQSRSSSEGLTYPPDNFPYTCIFFQVPDLIRIVYAPDDTEQALEAQVHENWDEGLKLKKSKNHILTLKLEGEPFKEGHWRQHKRFKLFVCLTLAKLREMGWQFVTSSDLSRADVISGMFFRRSHLVSPADLPAPHRIACVSMCYKDRLNFINFPAEFWLHAEECIRKHYKPKDREAGGQEPLGKRMSGKGPKTFGPKPKPIGPLIQKIDKGQGEISFKLRGTPWYSVKDDRHHGRQLMLEILNVAERQGWNLHGVGNLQPRGTISSSANPREGDTIYFVEGEPNLTAIYFMICLDNGDHVRLIGAPVETGQIIEEVLTKHWPKPIQKTSEYFGSYQWKLKGWPWSGEGEDGVYAVLLIIRLLQRLYTEGWSVAITMDTNQFLRNTSVFVMRKDVPRRMQCFCLDFKQTNHIRVIGAPKNAEDAIDKVLRERWSHGFEVSAPPDGLVDYELHEHPWGNDPQDGILARGMLCHMIHALEAEGWQLLAAAEITDDWHHQNRMYKEHCDSWFFGRARGRGRTQSLGAPRVTESMPVLEDELVEKAIEVF